MANTNYNHCPKCDKYYQSDYWFMYHQESKHSGLWKDKKGIHWYLERNFIPKRYR